MDKYSKTNFMEIPPVRAELFHADRRTDGHDEANSRFSQLCEKRLIEKLHSMFHDVNLNKQTNKLIKILRIYEAPSKSLIPGTLYNETCFFPSAHEGHFQPISKN
jgi:hypothetical protein